MTTVSSCNKWGKCCLRPSYQKLVGLWVTQFNRILDFSPWPVAIAKMISYRIKNLFEESESRNSTNIATSNKSMSRRRLLLFIAVDTIIKCIIVCLTM